ncbi:MAG TPA: choice-of-anchor tandem repeat GloVer-containing protein [Terriglobales bacterium]|jgi:uncharacterized repeat protein (TIGR03803 family)|nr:choice-of-anchor tandem repeat GloVer-containing protein [Terriglobales bacterium]
MKKALSTLALLTLTAALATLANAQVYTDLFNFRGPDGALPQGPSLLAQGRDGNLYGTASQGGAYRSGVVFEVTLDGKEKVLFNFDYQRTDGSLPFSGLTLGTDGDFYGTTNAGGTSTWGTIFKITSAGSLTTLYSFTGGADSGDPEAPPIQGANGTFYGTTSEGATPFAYNITSSGSFTVLGALPGSSYGLMQATDGNFYGTTYNGGRSSNCPAGCGTVFRMTPKGSTTTVSSFYGENGTEPVVGVTEGSDGNLYGTATRGGNYSRGVLFAVTRQGFTVLHDFGDPNYPNDGAYPYAGLVQASDGNLYGVASNGGTMNQGVMFQITPTGSYAIVYDFQSAGGGSPCTTPVQHTNGKIYGMACAGGSSNDGVVYSFDLGLPTFIRLVFAAGRIGQTGGILGQGFTGTNSVSFNGVPAAFKVESDTYLIATVPPGATTGFVTVVTPSGTLTSNQKFQVRP